MDVSTQLATNMEDLAKLFQSRMESYEQRLHNATAMPSQPADLSSLAREFVDFKTFVWETLSKLKKQIDLLTLGLDRHETFLRRKILLFHGVAETKNENLFDVVKSIITDKMNIEFTRSDIQTCHRLGPSSTKSRAVLVRFRDIEQRRLVWDAKTSLKSSGVVISEFLTKARHQAFVTARQHFGMRNCWSTDGKVVIILPDKSRRKIESMQELNVLMGTFPAVGDPKPASSHPAKSAHGEVAKPSIKDSDPKSSRSASSSRRARRN